jgi:hypothetical protein
MAATLAEKETAMLFEMPDEIDALHAVKRSGSRITSAPPNSS